ncbi:DnaJ domain-containing protein 5 [Elsinoe fawcettii]|nr:DnaJ domain-containing protein 5 [Elsinoe fawcettii]
MQFDILSMLGWLFLPGWVTGWVQSAYYAVWIRAGDPKPQRGSQRFANDYRTIYATVILAYLAYTVYNADHQLQQQSSFYHSLGVPLDVTERGLLSRFRRLTVQYHPDKITGPIDREIAESYYVHLKQCRDVLVDPNKRFAYDRFGTDMLEWQDAKTLFDYLYKGVYAAMMYYFGSVITLVFLSLVGYLKQGNFWRILATTIFFAFELYCMSRPEAPRILTHVVNPLMTRVFNHPPYLQFQFLALLRQILVSFFIALSQLGPILFPAQPIDGTEPTQDQFDRLDAVIKANQQESMRLTALELTPFAADPSSMRDLKTSMRQWLVDNTVRQNPQVRDAMGRVLQPRSGAMNGRPT